MEYQSFEQHEGVRYLLFIKQCTKIIMSGLVVSKIKHYLVDSENVNDNWLMLLNMADEEDEIIIFYTKKSPHMSYTSVIKLLQEKRTIQFEECFEGQNALDFQLISYLGYLIGKDGQESSEYIVMSNDTGFDPAVRFWKKKGVTVHRINVNYCKLGLQRHKSTDADADVNVNTGFSTGTEDVPVVNDAAPKEERDADSIVHEPPMEEHSSENLTEFSKEEVDTFINCFGKNNLEALHEILVHVYGQKQGQIIYKTVKDDSYSYDVETFSQQDKIRHFADIIFTRNDVTDPGDFVSFLEKNKDKAKNLNGIRAAIVKAYGKDNGMKYYSLFKPYFKMISALVD